MESQNTERSTVGAKTPVAYYYEFQIEDTSKTTSNNSSEADNDNWLTVLRQTHPEKTDGIKYRRLQRLIPLDEAVGTPDPVGFVFDIIPEKGPKKVEVTRSRITDDIEFTGTKITNIRPLVPVNADRGSSPTPEPFKQKGRAIYLEETKTLRQVYYRVDKVTGEATTMHRKSEDYDWELNENTRPERILELQLTNNVEAVPYDQTPFSLPKYQYTADEFISSTNQQHPTQ